MMKKIHWQAIAALSVVVLVMLAQFQVADAAWYFSGLRQEIKDGTSYPPPTRWVGTGNGSIAGKKHFYWKAEDRMRYAGATFEWTVFPQVMNPGGYPVTLRLSNHLPGFSNALWINTYRPGDADTSENFAYINVGWNQGPGPHIASATLIVPQPSPSKQMEIHIYNNVFGDLYHVIYAYTWR